MLTFPFVIQTDVLVLLYDVLFSVIQTTSRIDEILPIVSNVAIIQQVAKLMITNPFDNHRYP